MKRIISFLILSILILIVVGQIDMRNAYSDDMGELSCFSKLKELGILDGTANKATLSEKVTRLEGLIALIKLSGEQEKTTYYANAACNFYDVPDADVQYVNYAFHNGLSFGMGNGIFGSQYTISGQAFCTLLLRTLGYRESAGDFNSDTVLDKCISLGLITKDESANYTADELTRGSLAVLAYRALELKNDQEKMDASSGANGRNVQEFNAYGNGKTNDTAAIQKALDQCSSVYIPDGVYMIDGSVGLRPKSDQIITMSDHAVLKMIPNSSSSASMFRMANISNVTIEGGMIVGDCYTHNGSAGNGAGIYIGSNNNSITIKNMIVREFWGNGLYIGDTTQSRNINLDAVIGNDNSRGLYIKNGKNTYITDSLFANSPGAASGAGIVVEPHGGDAVSNVSVSNTWVFENPEGGFIINGTTGTVNGVEMTGGLANNNGNGIYLNTCKNVTVENTKLLNNAADGLTLVRDITNAHFADLESTGNGSRGVSLVTSLQKEGTSDIYFSKCVFANNSIATPEKYDGVRIDNYDSSKFLKHVEFAACSFIDNQEKPTQRYGLTVGTGAGVSNIIVETSCVFAGNVVSDMVSNNLVYLKVPDSYGQVLDVRNAGAMGDGVTDDTAAIQRALNASKNIVIPAGTYMINTRTGLRASAKQSILLETGATLKAIPNGEDFYRILDLTGVSDVTITGGTFLGDRNSHLSKSGEWGSGIYISSNAKNISIKGSTFEGFWGDGIYIGGGIASSDISIHGVVCNNNLRSGITITNVKNLTISDSQFTNSNGKAPQTGINIEPNPQETCDTITISGTKCASNVGKGINLLGSQGSIKNIVISDAEFSGNSDGIYMDACENITVKSSKITANKNFGLTFARDVTTGKFLNLMVANNASIGASLVTTLQTKGLTNLAFQECTFANNGLAQPGKNDGVRIDLYDLTGVIRNVQFYYCSFIDDQVSHTQRFGISVNTSSNVSGIYIGDDCFFKGNITGTIRRN